MTTTHDSRSEIGWVTQNHQLVAYADAKISIMAPGLTFAALVFEGFRAYWNDAQQALMIFRLEDHMKRLAFSMSLLELDDPPSSETFISDILSTLKANDFRDDTYIRLQVYVDDWGSMLATGPVGSSVICRPRPRVADFSTGKNFIVSSWRRNAENASPPRIKASANYLNSRLAGLEAKRQGAGGAVLLNDDGTVSEGPGGCLFFLRDGVFATPDGTSGILESVTRRTILDIAGPLGIETAERPVGRTELDGDGYLHPTRPIRSRIPRECRPRLLQRQTNPITIARKTVNGYEK